MPRRITIRRPSAPIRCTIELPRSKSIANRALVLASLAGDLSCVTELSDADDTRILHQLLRDKPRVMHCGAGGTTFRFLLAWACMQEGEEHVLTGDARLLERPHDDLINALRSLGAWIERTDEGYVVKGARLQGGNVALDSPMSSQFISALLLIAPRMVDGLMLRWTGRRLSEPYVRMTLKCLEHFGAEVEVFEDAIRVGAGELMPKKLIVPPDWSAASFWFAITALVKEADILLKGLHRDGWQGDEAIMRILSEWVEAEASPEGLCLKPFLPDVIKRVPELDLSDTPDLFQPLALLFAALGHTSHFTGLDNLSMKETDRIAAVAGTLSALGVPVHHDRRSLITESSLTSTDATLPVHGDHRMAMALALLAFRFGSISLEDPDVVNKSYPGFWDDLRKAGFGVELA